MRKERKHKLVKLLQSVILYVHYSIINLKGTYASDMAAVLCLVFFNSVKKINKKI